MTRDVYLVRHGQTRLNAAGLLRGRLDAPLDAVGQAQARDLATQLGGHGLSRIVSSPLRRATETAGPIAAAAGTPCTGAPTNGLWDPAPFHRFGLVPSRCRRGERPRTPRTPMSHPFRRSPATARLGWPAVMDPTVGAARNRQQADGSSCSVGSTYGVPSEEKSVFFHRVPQPSPQRMVPMAGHPLVVGITPGQSELVALTAASWSEALGGVPIYFGYVDRSRIVDEEYADGTVRHSDMDPDLADDSWRVRATQIQRFLAEALAEHKGPWEFRYLAGRPDRALTHLARAVDASAIIVGARHPSSTEQLREFLSESVALHLSRHQHRPVLIVPVAVVDWKAPTPW